MVEDLYTYNVYITGIGKVPVIAHTKYEAVDKAYSMHSGRQPDRSKYKAYRTR